MLARRDAHGAAGGRSAPATIPRRGSALAPRPTATGGTRSTAASGAGPAPARRRGRRRPGSAPAPVGGDLPPDGAAVAAQPPGDHRVALGPFDPGSDLFPLGQRQRRLARLAISQHHHTVVVRPPPQGGWRHPRQPGGLNHRPSPGQLPQPHPLVAAGDRHGRAPRPQPASQRAQRQPGPMHGLRPRRPGGDRGQRHVHVLLLHSRGQPTPPAEEMSRSPLEATGDIAR